MNNQDRRYKKTEAAIQDALVALLQKTDRNSVDLSSLSNEADINKSTFYLHYQSLGAAFRSLEDKSLSVLFESLSGSPGALEGLVKAFSEAVLTHKKLFYAVMGEPSAFYYDNFVYGVLPFLGLPQTKKGNAKYDPSFAMASSCLMALLNLYRLWILSGCRFAKEKVEGEALLLLEPIYKDLSSR